MSSRMSEDLIYVWKPFSWNRSLSKSDVLSMSKRSSGNEITYQSLVHTFTVAKLWPSPIRWYTYSFVESGICPKQFVNKVFHSGHYIVACFFSLGQGRYVVLTPLKLAHTLFIRSCDWYTLFWNFWVFERLQKSIQPIGTISDKIGSKQKFMALL